MLCKPYDLPAESPQPDDDIHNGDAVSRDGPCKHSPVLAYTMQCARQRCRHTGCLCNPPHRQSR